MQKHLGSEEGQGQTGRPHVRSSSVQRGGFEFSPSNLEAAREAGRTGQVTRLGVEKKEGGHVIINLQ